MVKTQLKHLQNQYNALREKMSRLIDMRSEGELTKDEFSDQKERLLDEQARLKALLDDNEDSAINWFELASNFLNTAHSARNIMEHGKPEEKRELILTVGENLFLKDKKIEIKFKKPFDVLLKSEYRTNGLPLIGTFINNPSSQYLDKQSELMLQSLLAYQQNYNRDNYLTAN